MAYTPTVWQNGDKITEQRMNKLEHGVESASLGGVTSFNGRSGAVAPQSGDYTAEDVGAVPSGDVSAIVSMTEAEYNALVEKPATTLYLIKE